jgi:hypothetical protein
MIYVPINDNGMWRRRYNNELYDMIYLLTVIGLTPGGSSAVHIDDELDVVKVIK